MSEAPESDRVEGAPHPRETPRLFGHEAAERQFLDAFARGRLHHGWLITGPRGVGKATLAWRIARFLRAEGEGGGGLFGAPESLDVAPEHPVARLVAAGAEPGILPIRRALDDKASTPRLKTQITVDEVRKLRDFFGLTAAEGGWRVVIVDPADELNPSAANALLKLLEEPPAGAILLLVAHQPSALLPTIRSRCRELRLGPLSPADLGAALAGMLGDDGDGDAGALAQLSGGSVGEALRVLNGGGLELYAGIIDILAGLPSIDRPAVLKLCATLGGREAEPRFDLTVRLFDLALARMARAGAMGQPMPEAAPGEAELQARLAPDARAARHWAECAADLGARARAARAVNLDPGALVLDMFLRLESAARMATG